MMITFNIRCLFQGAAYLKSLLPNVRKYHVINDWNHIDFVYNRNARKFLYNEVLSDLQNMIEIPQNGASSTRDLYPQSYTNNIVAGF